MIQATVTTKRKEYVDRGVQTELMRRLSRDPCKPMNPRTYDPPAPVTPPTTFNSSLFAHSPTVDAYSYSPASSGRATGPTRSPSTSRKHAQLPYSRPSQLQNLTQRVLSLPETSPPYRTRVSQELRTVSLSELPRASLSFSDNTIESSASADTSFLSENRSGSSRHRRSFPSSDMPHTPSPPSSPESVMIIGIGNDRQVPLSFLRQKAKTYEKDNGGWISWASSPPKPIPALHGPLSLPYARCPSGAEGTIIEGEDLSRMIWGLGIDDGGVHSTHSRANSTQKSTPKPSFTPCLQTQLDNVVSRQIHHAPPRHQLQALQDRQHLSSLGRPDIVHREIRNQIIDQRAMESLGPRHSFRPHTQDHGLNVIHPPDPRTGIHGTRDDLIGSLQDQLYTYDGQRGLGFDWQKTLRDQLSCAAETARLKSQKTLKPSAAVFVPASQQATHQYPHIFVEPRMPHTINPTQRLTAIEIAQQYHTQHHTQQRPQSSLPTPPGSSSPRWTPHLPSYTDPFPPLDLHNLLPVKQQSNTSQHPLVRQLQQIPQDPSQQLRQFVFDRIHGPNLNATRNPSIGFTESVLQLDQNLPYMASPALQYRRPTIDVSPPHPGPPPNSPLPPVPSSRGRALKPFIAPSSPTSPDTSVPPRNAAKTPRSVPFARLLQRRLSSVPEEESEHYMEPYSPPPSPPKTSTTLRLPRPPSHTLADSFQSRSHPTGSGRHHVTRTPSPGPSNVFGSPRQTTGELASGEARRRSSGSTRGKGSSIKQPFVTVNLDAGSDSRGEDSARTDGSAGENVAWEKQNGHGKPKKKGRSKKAKGGSSGEDNISPWLASSQGPEAWIR